MTREPFKISKAAYFPEHLSMATSESRTSMHNRLFRLENEQCIIAVFETYAVSFVFIILL